MNKSVHMTKIMTIRLLITSIQKKMEAYEAELELLYFQLDEEQEKSLTK
jgi:hypothetical protein